MQKEADVTTFVLLKAVDCFNLEVDRGFGAVGDFWWLDTGPEWQSHCDDTPGRQLWTYVEHECNVAGLEVRCVSPIQHVERRKKAV